MEISLQAGAATSLTDPGELEEVNFDRLENRPFGWDDTKIPGDALGWAKTLVGWLTTIAVISLGAPFWFDLLGKVANLKGSGGKAQARRA